MCLEHMDHNRHLQLYTTRKNTPNQRTGVFDRTWMPVWVLIVAVVMFVNTHGISVFDYVYAQDIPETPSAEDAEVELTQNQEQTQTQEQSSDDSSTSNNDDDEENTSDESSANDTDEDTSDNNGEESTEEGDEEEGQSQTQSQNDGTQDSDGTDENNDMSDGMSSNDGEEEGGSASSSQQSQTQTQTQSQTVTITGLNGSTTIQTQSSSSSSSTTGTGSSTQTQTQTQTQSQTITINGTSSTTTLPTVDLQVNGSNGPLTIGSDVDHNLSWTVSDANSCNATGDWNGSKATSSSSENLGPRAEDDYTYTLTCENDDGSQSDTVNVTVDDGSGGGGGGGSNGQAPSVTLKANGVTGTTTATTGESIVLNWDLDHDPETCTATGDWNGSKATSSSSENLGPTNATGTFQYSLTCENDDGSGEDSVAVVVENNTNGGGGGGGNENAPVVTLTANGVADTVTVDEEENVTLEWSLENNPTSCEAFGAWSGSKATSSNATENIGALSIGTHTFSLTCENDDGNDDDSVVVIVEEGQTDTPGNGGGGGGGGHTGGISGGGYLGLDIRNEKVERLSDTSVRITWDTNRDATRQVVYGTQSVLDPDADNTQFGYQYNTVEVVDPRMRDHGIIVTGLQPGQEYFFRPVSRTDSDEEIGVELSLTSTGQVAGIQSCSYLEDHLHIDWNNDPLEVAKMQWFLREFEGYDLDVDGDYDQETHDRVVAFQERYSEDILEPWGYTQGTGFTYITTKNKVNEIICDRAVSFTPAEQREIEQYQKRINENVHLEYSNNDNNLKDISNKGHNNIIQEMSYNMDDTTASSSKNDDISLATTTDIDYTVSDMLATTGKKMAHGVVASMLMPPQDWSGILQCLSILILVLVSIYFIGSFLVEMHSSDDVVPTSTVRTRKLLTFIAGLVMSLMLAYWYQFFCLIIPLLIVVVALAIAILWFVEDFDDTDTGSATAMRFDTEKRQHNKDTESTQHTPDMQSSEKGVGDKKAFSPLRDSMESVSSETASNGTSSDLDTEDNKEKTQENTQSASLDKQTEHNHQKNAIHLGPVTKHDR